MRLALGHALSSLAVFCFGVVGLCAYLILITSFLPIFLFRFFLCKTSKVINPQLGKMVTARGQFLAAEQFTSGKSSRAAIVFVGILEGNQTVDRTRQLFLNNLVQQKTPSGELKYPEFQQYVTTWLGFRFWKPEAAFSIEEHVQPYQKTKVFTDEDLRAFMESLLNQPFQPEKSPWTVYVTNNYINPKISKKEMTVVTTLLHHCLSDGYGILHVYLENLGSKAPVLPYPVFASRTTWKQFLFQLTAPFRMINELAHFIEMSLRTVHPWKIADSKKSWKQLYARSEIIPVEKIKAIKNKFGVSYTSVLHSAYAAASRKSLVQMYGAMGDSEEIPCAMMLPLPDHPKRLRNHVTGAYIKLPIKNCDPVARLKLCQQQINLAKSSTMPFLGKILPVIGGSLTTNLAALVGKNRSFPVGISNFPVGTCEYEWLERKIVNVVVGAGATVGVAGVAYLVSSYNKGVQFTVTAESAVMTPKDLERLVYYIENEIDTLYSLSKI